MHQINTRVRALPVWFLSVQYDSYLGGFVGAAEAGEQGHRGGRGVVSIIMISKGTGMKGRIHGDFG